METLAIFLHANNFWVEHDWYWSFPLFMLFVFVIMCFLFRGWRRRNNSCWCSGWTDYSYKDKSNAKEILKERYAKGEIRKEEYERMMKDIS